MAYHTIQSFIDKLEEKGELVRIKEYVSPDLEMSEINDRFVKNNGKALLFENTGTEFPVLLNMMGSYERVCMALNVNEIDDLGLRIQSIFKMVSSPKDSLMEKLKMLPQLGEISSWTPSKSKGRGLCQEVEMDVVDLSKIPVLKTWPFDGGPFITFPMVHSQSLENGITNIGMYRMQVLDNQSTGMHWHLHKGGATHYREYQKAGKRMPISVTIGGDPAYIYAATAPLPENISEYLLAGFLRQKKVKLVKCLTNDIYVPEDVDFVIEGYVDPMEDKITEGPFGDHTGYYSLADLYPKFHITKITHRKNAVYSATVVGIPPQEDAWIGLATERIFMNPMKMTMVPEIQDMHMPMEGVFHNVVLASIESHYQGQALKVMNALWGAGQMMFNKFLFLTDEKQDLKDYHKILQLWSDRVHPIDDVLTTRGPMDVLDHASATFAFGGKMGFDATHEKDLGLKELKPNIEAIRDLEWVHQVHGAFVENGIRVLLLSLKERSKNICRKVAKVMVDRDLIQGLSFVIFVEKIAPINDYANVVWRVANNVDPSRDCFYMHDNQMDTYPCLFMDGDRKYAEHDGFTRDWPNIVCMDEATIQKVDAKWESYNIGEFLESPSKKYRKELYLGDDVAR